MANPEHLETLRQGFLEWNAWREQHPRVRPDLRGSALSETVLRRYDLRGADVRGASLLAANLDGADLRRADLSGCDLRFCSWRGARLSQAKLLDCQGVDQRMLRAAERIEWRDRIPSLPVAKAGVAAAVFALLWAAAQFGVPEQSGLGSPPMFQLAAAVSDAGFAEQGVEGVAISGGLMRIRLGVEELTADVYLETLVASCGALEGRTLQPAIKRIEILQIDGQAGWLFEQADRCPQVLTAARERVAITVAAASVPIRPKPSPSALHDAR